MEPEDRGERRCLAWRSGGLSSPSPSPCLPLLRRFSTCPLLLCPCHVSPILSSLFLARHHLLCVPTVLLVNSTLRQKLMLQTAVCYLTPRTQKPLCTWGLGGPTLAFRLTLLGSDGNRETRFSPAIKLLLPPCFVGQRSHRPDSRGGDRPRVLVRPQCGDGGGAVCAASPDTTRTQSCALRLAPASPSPPWSPSSSTEWGGGDGWA